MAETVSPSGVAHLHRYTSPPAELFLQNRQRFTEQLAPGSVALFFSNPRINDNADSHYPFTQDRNFYYLTGIDQEECILMLFPEAPKESWREVLFVRKTDAHIQVWEGYKYTQEQARAASGVSTIQYVESFEALFQSLVQRVENIYLDFNEHGRNSSYTYTEAHKFADGLARKFPGHTVKRAAPILSYLRMFKRPEEVEQMRKACGITEKAFRHVLQVMKPGRNEREIEAEVRYIFGLEGSRGPAYSPIVASGSNACILHYNVNGQQIQDGELVLMDFGAEYANYASDLTRTIPANGTFTERQLAVYNAVLRVQQAAIQKLKPSVDFQHYVEEAGEHMQEELLALGLLTAEEVKAAPKENPAYKKYFPHGLSHHIGLDTHDQGDFFITLEPGMVFTVEPGIYLPEEGIGIRLENDILVTEDGFDDLMANIPIEADEIQQLMAQ